MNYSEDTKFYGNVTVQSYSPRADGEHEARSEWKEVKELYQLSYHERLTLIGNLGRDNSQVVVRPATYGGKMRIWIKS